MLNSRRTAEYFLVLFRFALLRQRLRHIDAVHRCSGLQRLDLRSCRFADRFFLFWFRSSFAMLAADMSFFYSFFFLVFFEVIVFFFK